MSDVSSFSRTKDLEAIGRYAKTNTSKEFKIASDWTIDQISRGNVRHPEDRSRLREWEDKRKALYA